MTIGILLNKISLIAFATSLGLTTAQNASWVIRNRDGSAACVISAAGGAGQMSVLVRGPASPVAKLVPRLPPERRDFSALPVRVVLLSGKSDESPRERRPTAIEALSEYPVIDGVSSAVPYTRVRFPRAWLDAGTVVLGERTVALSAKDRITSQTTCRITEADAAQWR
jgi:hypothetical protein